MADSPQILLRKLRLTPKHSWGQNFLGDDDVLLRIVDEAMIVPADHVVELGAGLGHLTRHLLETGATITTVERDRDMVEALKGMADFKGLDLVEGNATEVDFAAIAKADQVIVVGNLPYHLTSSILFAVLDQADHVQRALFTLQKEVVVRLTAEPGGREYGLLSVLLGLRFHVEYCFDVPSEFFHPPPKVDSAVVRLSRRSTPKAAVTSESRFRQVVKAGFAQRRKTLMNSLKSDPRLVEQFDLLAALERAGIDPKRRAETLAVEEFAALERALSPRKEVDRPDRAE